MAVQARVKAPKKAKKGEVMTIKTTISHKMETGQRKDRDGNPIPRQIINKFEAKMNGNTVVSADWHPAISANPYFEFTAVATESGTMEFFWYDDAKDDSGNPKVYTAKADIEVS